MLSAAPSFCQATENTLAAHRAPATGDGPALVEMATVPESTITLWLAIMTLEKPRPTMAFTRSLSMNLRAIWLPTSGLSWSSSFNTVTTCPPSLPPPCSSASMKPSYWSCPTTATGPERGAEKPILIWARAGICAASSNAHPAMMYFLFILSPCYSYVISPGPRRPGHFLS